MGNKAKIERLMIYYKNRMVLGKGFFSNGDYRNYVSLEEINSAIEELSKENNRGIFHLITNGYINCDPKVLDKYEIDSILEKFVPVSKVRSRTIVMKPTTPKEETPIIEDSEPKKTDEPIISSEPLKEETSDTHLPVEEEEDAIEPAVATDDPIDSAIVSEPVEEEKVEPVVAADGSIEPVVVSDPALEEEVKEVKKSKKKKGIKNFKAVGITLVAGALAVGGILYSLSGGFNDMLANNTNTKNGSKVNGTINGEEFSAEYDDSLVLEDSNGYNLEEEETYYQNNYGSSIPIAEEDMLSQTDAVNNICFGFQRCTLERLVTENDFDTIYTINSVRNDVISNRCDAETFMNNIVNYLFESGNNFKGHVIKPYSALSPFAQYIVLVASQSILVEKCPSYSHQTQYNYYDASNLSIAFDSMIDITYRELNDNSKTL